MSVLSEKAITVANNEYVQFKPHETISNRGARIDLYQQAVGLKLDLNKPGYPWCACFVYFCCLKGGYAARNLPMSPMSPGSVYGWATWAGSHKSGSLIVTNPEKVKRGDLFYWLNDNLTGHIGFVLEVRKVLGVWWFRTIEGNANSDPSEREGVEVVKRGKDGDLTVLGWRRVTNRTCFIKLSEVG